MNLKIDESEIAVLADALVARRNQIRCDRAIRVPFALIEQQLAQLAQIDALLQRLGASPADPVNMTFWSDLKKRPVSSLTFSARTKNVLAAQGIATVEDLVAVGPIEVLKMPNAGKKTLAEVEAKMRQLGVDAYAWPYARERAT